MNPKLHLWDTRNSKRWLSDLKRYPSVRFTGLSLGRLFIGVVCGGKVETWKDRYHEQWHRAEELARQLEGGDDE